LCYPTPHRECRVKKAALSIRDNAQEGESIRLADAPPAGVSAGRICQKYLDIFDPQEDENLNFVDSDDRRHPQRPPTRPRRYHKLTTRRRTERLRDTSSMPTTATSSPTSTHSMRRSKRCASSFRIIRASVTRSGSWRSMTTAILPVPSRPRASYRQVTSSRVGRAQKGDPVPKGVLGRMSGEVCRQRLDPQGHRCPGPRKGGVEREQHPRV
jgi:hypothetical protein